MNAATAFSSKMEQRAQAILSHTPELSVHDSRSLLRILVPPKAAGIAVFVAAGCSFADIKKAGFSLAEASASGCDSYFLVSCALAMHKHTFSN